MPALDADPVRVSLLGPVALDLDGRPARIGGVRPRAVLAVLAAAGTPMPAQRLAEAVWSDTGRPATRTTLHVHVHALRQALAPHTASLQHTPAGYRLSGAVVDVRLAEDLLARARTAERAGDLVGAAASYRSALDLWRGEFCADLPALAHLDGAREVYGTLRADAVEAAAAVDLRLGFDVARQLGDLTRRHPLRERAWALLVAALYRDGRQVEALDAARAARAVLAEEVGVDPGPQLRDVERAVRDQVEVTGVLQIVADRRSGSRAGLGWVDSEGRPRTRELPSAGRLVIGRDPAGDVVLAGDDAVSRRHAALDVSGGQATVVDLGSRNGTFHNGTRIGSEPVRVRPGDVVRCGTTVLALAAPAPTAAGPPAATRSGPV